MAEQPDSTLRTCKHCKIEKPLPEFVKQGKWRTHKCRACRSRERREAYAQRAGEYANWDDEQEKVKRAANSRRQRGRYLWDDSWLNKLAHKTCARCKIELPANPAWFRKDTANTTGLSSWCRACEARYYDENKVKRNEEQRARWHRLFAENPEKVRRERRERRRRAGERNRAYMRFWREANRERYLALGIAKENKRRARKINAPGSFGPSDIAAMHEAQKGRCWYCSKKMKKYHVEHRIPLSRGGSNNPSNLVLACPPCNWSKGTKMPWELEEARLL